MYHGTPFVPIAALPFTGAEPLAYVVAGTTLIFAGFALKKICPNRIK